MSLVPASVLIARKKAAKAAGTASEPDGANPEAVAVAETKTRQIKDRVVSEALRQTADSGRTQDTEASRKLKREQVETIRAAKAAKAAEDMKYGKGVALPMSELSMEEELQQV